MFLIEFNPEAHRLGKICKRGHEYKDTGMGWWYIKNGKCVECERMYSQSQTAIENNLKYQQSDTCKETRKAYRESEHGRLTKMIWDRSDTSKAYQKKYNQSEAGKARAKKHNQTDRRKMGQKKHRQSDKCKATRLAWEQSDTGKASRKKTQKKYRESEQGKITRCTHKREWERKRKAIDPLYKLIHTIYSVIGQCFKKNGVTKNKHTFEMLDWKPSELRPHLEQLFTDGMTVDNYGEWHIDHKVPISSFDFHDKVAIKKCFSLSNTQPLWKEDNLRKGNTISAEWDNNYMAM